MNHVHIKPPKDGGAVDVWGVLYFFQMHASLIMLCVAFGLTLAVCYLRWATPYYTSSGVLEVAYHDRTLKEFQDDPDSSADLGSASLLKTVERSVDSGVVLDRVVAANHLAEDPTFAPPGTSVAQLANLLDQRSSVYLNRGTRLINVDVQDTDPQRAQRLAQSIIDEYFKLGLENRRTTFGNARAFLMAEARRAADKLEQSERQLQQYKEKYDALGLADRQSLVVERIKRLHEQVSDARNIRLALESEQAQISAALASGRIGDLLALHTVNAQPEVSDLRRRIDELTAQQAALSERYRAKHPAMVRLQQQLTETRANLERTARNAALTSQHSFQAAKSTEESLQRELARQEQAAVALDRQAIEYRALDRDVQANTALYQQVLARLKETGVTENLIQKDDFSGGLVKVVQKPFLPEVPTSPRWKLVLAAGLLAGGVLGCGAALVRHALDDSINSVDAAEAHLGASTLAVIPQSRRLGFRHGHLTVPRPGAPDVEAFRSLRTSLSLMRDAHGHHALMFTSAAPGEGKSCCAANYAVVVAQSGQRTLLIDGDLRRPVLRQAFRRRGTRTALTDCIRDPSQLDRMVEATMVPNLSLLANSAGTAYSSEWLASGNLKGLLEKALSQYDRVIIDTAPVAVVSDALYFARLVPTVCFVVHAGVTPKRVVRRACDRLREVAGTAYIGVVLNQIQRGVAASYHYYYYGPERAGQKVASAPAAAG
jgi:succinoglycan biosynthesis transport protein ExoP